MDIISPLLVHEKSTSLLWHFFQNPKPEYNHEKNIRQTQIEGHCKIFDYFLKTVKVVKDRERLRNCHRTEETMGI